MRTGVRTLEMARHLRGDMSPPEVLLWVRLRGRGHGGPRFRRQHPIGPYVADFYCPAARLVVEIDGIVHATGAQPERDARRDRWMAAEGYRIVRIAAAEVLADPDEIAQGLWRLADGLTRDEPF